MSCTINRGWRLLAFQGGGAKLPRPRSCLPFSQVADDPSAAVAKRAAAQLCEACGTFLHAQTCLRWAPAAGTTGLVPVARLRVLPCCRWPSTCMTSALLLH